MRTSCVRERNYCITTAEGKFVMSQMLGIQNDYGLSHFAIEN